MADNHCESSPDFWVLAKRLDGSKWKKLHFSNLYELTADFQYWAFRPTSATDFVRKQTYGRIESKGKELYMYHHLILFMSESEALVDKALSTGKDPIKNTKIENPSKRKSLVENKYPLSRYTLRSEEKTATSSVKSTNKAKSNVKAVSNAIAREFEKKAANNQCGQSSSNIPPSNISLEVGDVNNCLDSDHSNDELQKMKEQMAALIKENELMKERIKSQEAQTPQAALIDKELVRSLAKEVIEEVKKAVPSTIQSRKDSSCSCLEKLQNAMDPAEKPPEPVEEGKVYMGCEQPVLLKELVKLQRKHFTFTSRVNALLDLIWGPDNVHKYYGGKRCPASGKQVSEDVKTCILNILLAMKWAKDDQVDVTEPAVKRQIDKQTSYRRSVLKQALLPSPVKNMLKEKKKARKEELKNAGVKKQFIIKNRKRVKVKGPPAPPPKKEGTEGSAAKKNSDPVEDEGEESNTEAPGSNNNGEEKTNKAAEAEHQVSLSSDEETDSEVEMSDDKSSSSSNAHAPVPPSQRDLFHTEYENYEKNEKKKLKKKRKAAVNSTHSTFQVNLSESESSDEESKQEKKKKKHEKSKPVVIYTDSGSETDYPGHDPDN